MHYLIEWRHKKGKNMQFSKSISYFLFFFAEICILNLGVEISIKLQNILFESECDLNTIFERWYIEVAGQIEMENTIEGTHSINLSIILYKDGLSS